MRIKVREGSKTCVPNHSIMTPVNHSQNRLSKVFSRGHARQRLQRLKTSRLSLLLTFPPHTSSSRLFLSEASVLLPVTLEYMTHSRDFSCAAHRPNRKCEYLTRTFKAATCTAFDYAKRFCGDAASPLSSFQDHQLTSAFQNPAKPCPQVESCYKARETGWQSHPERWRADVRPYRCYDGGGTQECDCSRLTGTSRSIQ